MSVIFPAEWFEQDAILIAWPHSGTDWKRNLKQIQQLYLQLVSKIAHYQRLVILVPDNEVKTQALGLFQRHGVDEKQLTFFNIDYNDTWLRDYGPLSVRCNDVLHILDFKFNAWGGKFSYELDNKITNTLMEQQVLQSAQYEKIDVVLEGGSIDTDGSGSLLTTSSCLLNNNRNPGMSKSMYEQMFCDTMGIRQVHWINNSYLAGDDTDGHIDMLARFCNPMTIVYTSCDDKADENYDSLCAMKQELESFTTLDNKPYKLIALPMPSPIYNADGNRLPASYANFLVINNAIIVPVYDDVNDAHAITQLQRYFPDRKIEPVNALAAIEQGGSIHCLTMNLPRGVQPGNSII